MSGPATAESLTGAVHVAIIAALASLLGAAVTSIVGYISARRSAREQATLEKQRNAAVEELENKRAEIADEFNEKNARRSYEYDARRRLYAEAEPLLFDMFQDAGFTLNQLKNLARASRNGVAAAWLSDDDPYYMRSTIYALLVPLASLHLLRQRLTASDLTLDSRIERQYELIKAARRTFNRDFFFAEREPRIDYKPIRDSFIGPYDRRSSQPQGILGGDLQRAISVMIQADNNKERVSTFDEFTTLLDIQGSPAKDRIYPLVQLFTGFSPDTKPVVIRILTAQIFLYRAIRLFRSECLSDEDLITKCELSEREALDYTFSVESTATSRNFEIGRDNLRDSLSYNNPFPS